MTKLRILIGFSVMVLLVVLCSLAVNFITIKDMFLGALFGAAVSLIITVPFEYLTYTNQQQASLDDFFWKGVAPYRNALDVLFENVEKFMQLNDIFTSCNINENERDRETYQKMYTADIIKFKPIIQEFVDVLLHFYNVHENDLAYLSSLLKRIERKDLIGRENVKYNQCYAIYELVRNFECTLEDQKSKFINISKMEEGEEKIYKYIEFFQKFSDIVIKSEMETEEIPISDLSSIEEEKIKFKKEFDNAIYKLINPKNK